LLILTYHAVERGPGPLFVDPDLFRGHLDCIVAARAQTLTISELARCIATGALPERGVALTFDDAFSSVALTAAPLMAERGLTGTAFCIAERVGEDNRWPTQPALVPRRPLVDRDQIRELVAAGFEIGSHGMDHRPLRGAAHDQLRRQLSESRSILEEVAGRPVESFAFPYGEEPAGVGRQLLAREYRAACGCAMGWAGSASDVLALPRVDIHYLRRPRLLSAALEGTLDGYIGARRFAARARRMVKKDYVSCGPRT
jgi:peptidoglycan/xylan/chitin deacetylase (PgdA/CDA1 family)